MTTKLCERCCYDEPIVFGEDVPWMFRDFYQCVCDACRVALNKRQDKLEGGGGDD